MTPPPLALVKAVKALSCPVRLEIPGYLEDPVAHFPAQVEGIADRHAQEGVDFCRRSEAALRAFLKPLADTPTSKAIPTATH